MYTLSPPKVQTDTIWKKNDIWFSPPFWSVPTLLYILNGLGLFTRCMLKYLFISIPFQGMYRSPCIYSCGFKESFQVVLNWCCIKYWVIYCKQLCFLLNCSCGMTKCCPLIGPSSILTVNQRAGQNNCNIVSNSRDPSICTTYFFLPVTRSVIAVLVVYLWVESEFMLVQKTLKYEYDNCSRLLDILGVLEIQKAF